MLIDELMLLSGHDIPFPQAETGVHPPTINELSYITERNFFLVLLCISGLYILASANLFC